MAFLDHWKKFYLPDSQLYEAVKLLHKGSLISADNIDMPELLDTWFMSRLGVEEGRDCSVCVHAITRSITPKIPISSPLPTTPASSNVALSSPSGTSTPTPAASAYSLPNPGAPVTGLESLETDKFRLTCFQTLTGTKFLLFTDPLMANIDAVMKKIYELYSDYVMKNPFYQLEMPVRCEAFDRHLGGWLRGRT
ncbi:sybindin [Aspergillus fumigatus]|nr:sybindin [Aspergillus fumigatus]